MTRARTCGIETSGLAGSRDTTRPSQGFGLSARRRPRILMRNVVLPLVCSALLVGQAPPPSPISGFLPESAKRERELEARFDQSLKRQDFQQWLKRLSSKPHHVGSP